MKCLVARRLVYLKVGISKVGKWADSDQGGTGLSEASQTFFPCQEC